MRAHKPKSMSKNTDKNTSKSTVSGSSQVLNPTTGHYIRRDSKTGKFMDVKTDGKPFKGVKTKNVSVQSNPNIKNSTALAAERAVIAVRNKSIDK